jgi:hypothetical protein
MPAAIRGADMHAHRVSRPRTAIKSPAAEVAGVVFFTEVRGTLSGTGHAGRRWQVLPVRTGWRLEFRDPGDGIATYAGTYATPAAAQRAAA